MDLTPHVESLRRDLLAAAESGGSEARAVAERLGYALEPSARLALMEAISQAATEITAAMPAGGVDVRLDGRDLAFVVDASPAVPSPPAPPAPPGPPLPLGGSSPEDATEDGVSRVTVRMPESVKAKAEAAAAAAGQSLNTWLVTVVRSATSEPVATEDIAPADLGRNFPFGARGGRRVTGWI